MPHSTAVRARAKYQRPLRRLFDVSRVRRDVRQEPLDGAVDGWPVAVFDEKRQEVGLVEGGVRLLHKKNSRSDKEIEIDIAYF